MRTPTRSTRSPAPRSRPAAQAPMTVLVPKGVPCGARAPRQAELVRRSRESDRPDPSLRPAGWSRPRRGPWAAHGRLPRGVRADAVRRPVGRPPPGRLACARFPDDSATRRRKLKDSPHQLDTQCNKTLHAGEYSRSATHKWVAHKPVTPERHTQSNGTQRHLQGGAHQAPNLKRNPRRQPARTFPKRPRRRVGGLAPRPSTTPRSTASSRHCRR
jgi:hypothetical protein